VANTPSVELFINGISRGQSSAPSDRYLFAFPDIEWEPGTLEAVGYDSAVVSEGVAVTRHELTTAGEPAAIRLTPTLGPSGLQADGADIAMFDVEVVDANGQRCPTDEARIDFAMSGPGIWRGGYNSGVVGSINQTNLLTEAGVNRVFVRTTLTPGTITVTATRDGLTPGAASVSSSAIPVCRRRCSASCSTGHRCW